MTPPAKLSPLQTVGFASSIRMESPRSQTDLGLGKVPAELPSILYFAGTKEIVSEIAAYLFFFGLFLKEVFRIICNYGIGGPMDDPIPDVGVKDMFCDDGSDAGHGWQIVGKMSVWPRSAHLFILISRKTIRNFE